MITEIVKNTTHYLEVIVTNTSGEGVTGLTINYTIYKSGDNSTVETGALNEIGNGVYKKDILIVNTGQYRVIYDTPTGYEDKLETLLIVDERAKESTLTTYDEYFKRLLGLNKEYYKVLSLVHDVNGNLTSATIKTFDNAIDYDAETNPIGVYSFSATYDVNNRVTTTGVKKVG